MLQFTRKPLSLLLRRLMSAKRERLVTSAKCEGPCAPIFLEIERRLGTRLIGNYSVNVTYLFTQTLLQNESGKCMICAMKVYLQTNQAKHWHDLSPSCIHSNNPIPFAQNRPTKRQECLTHCFTFAGDVFILRLFSWKVFANEDILLWEYCFETESGQQVILVFEQLLEIISSHLWQRSGNRKPMLTNH